MCACARESVRGGDWLELLRSELSCCRSARNQNLPGIEAGCSEAGSISCWEAGSGSYSEAGSVSWEAGSVSYLLGKQLECCASHYEVLRAKSPSKCCFASTLEPL